MQFLGTVVSVRGSVVDVRFDARLPPIYSVLHAQEGDIVIEVLAQLDAHRVRGIALTPTQGLARGMAVEDTGGPLKAPVGKGILSRMFDVFGNAIDRQAAPAEVRWRTGHRAPPALARRSTKSEMFEAGIKVIQKERDEFQRKNEELDRQRAALLSQATDEARAERHRLIEEAQKAADAVSAKRQETLRNDAQNLNQAIRRRTQQEVFAIARKALADLATTSLEERLGEVFTRRLREMSAHVDLEDLRLGVGARVLLGS
jgi:F0F1-type ATP synthase membrane subunit b/b'